MNRHQRRAEQATLSKLAVATRRGLAEKVEALRNRALAAPDLPQRAIAGRWVLMLSHHPRGGALDGDAFKNEAALAVVKVAGWTDEQITTMTAGAPFWMLTTSLEGRPRSSCDDDWVNLGIIHEVLGVPAEQGKEIITATDPGAIHHFTWTVETVEAN